MIRRIRSIRDSPKLDRAPHTSTQDRDSQRRNAQAQAPQLAARCRGTPHEAGVWQQRPFAASDKKAALHRLGGDDALGPLPGTESGLGAGRPMANAGYPTSGVHPRRACVVLVRRGQDA